jgi:16S rRNA C1402 N4-methylase RsmH
MVSEILAVLALRPGEHAVDCTLGFGGHARELCARLAPGGRLSARLPGWEARPQQMEMANLIAAAIAERRHAIVEAVTGVGKSLAYLVPAVLAVTPVGGAGSCSPVSTAPEA